MGHGSQEQEFKGSSDYIAELEASLGERVTPCLKEKEEWRIQGPTRQEKPERTDSRTLFSEPHTALPPTKMQLERNLSDTGLMAQLLRAHAALLEVLGSGLSTHSRQAFNLL